MFNVQMFKCSNVQMNAQSDQKGLTEIAERDIVP